jgi:hypothetical protein
MPEGRYPPQFDQLQRTGAISFGPFAARTARGKAHERILIIKTIELAIDPPMAKRGIDRFRF